LGHVAMRDFVSFLRYEAEDHSGHVNPLRERGLVDRKSLRLGPIANRTMPARLRRSRVQRRRRRTKNIRRHLAACSRSRTNLAQPSLRQCRRLRGPAIRRPLQPRRQLLVFYAGIVRKTACRIGGVRRRLRAWLRSPIAGIVFRRSSSSEPCGCTFAEIMSEPPPTSAIGAMIGVNGESG
jgi:hypothetical protein